MLSYLPAILGLGVLIVVHEAGHMLVARLCGMRVPRFSVGFGKTLFSFKRGETTYQLAAIPLGGFVQITGLNPHEEFDTKDPYVYPNRPKWMRLATLAAGPAANYLMASVIAFFMFLSYGKGTPAMKVDAVLPGSPAQTAGFAAGDVLVEANGQALSTALPINKILREAQGAAIKVTVKRGAETLTLPVTGKKDPDSGDYRIGIRLGQVRRDVPVPEAMTSAVVLPFVESGNFLRGFYEMITGKQKANLSGPIGIAQHMKEAAQQGAADYFHLLMMLSTYLGLFNLLPLPALDGGRIVFVGINGVRSLFRSKEMDAVAEAKVHMVGMLLLMGMFVLVTFKDIKDIILRFVN